MVGLGQRIVLGIETKTASMLAGSVVLRVLTHPVMRAGILVEAFADLVDLCGFIRSSQPVPLIKNGKSVKTRIVSKQSLSVEAQCACVGADTHP